MYDVVHYNPAPGLQQVQYRYRSRNLAWDRINAHLAKFGDVPTPFNVSRHVTDPESVLAKFYTWFDCAQAAHPLPAPLRDLELKAREKWIGPQGGTPSAAQLIEGARRYYANPSGPGTHTFPAPSERVKAWFWGEWMRTEAVYKPLTPVQIYKLYQGDHRSNSGLTTWADRRLRESIATACRDAAAFATSDPVVGGSRRQRNKNNPPRNIFMSSQGDLLRYGRLFRFLHDAFASSSTVLWRGDRYAELTVSRFLARHPQVVWVGGDYETLDIWVTYDHAVWVTKVIAEVLDLPQVWLDSAFAYWRAAFATELILPGFIVMEGFHSLFSGLPETNDIESWLNLLVQLMWIDAMFPQAELHRDFEIIVIGDDSLILLDATFLGERTLAEVQTSFADFAWENFRLRANALKQDVRTDGLAFCKRVYWRGGKTRVYPTFSAPVSAYPLHLVLNSIVYPESDDGDASAFLTRIAQLLDNAWGHPLWRAGVAFVWQHVTPVREYWQHGVSPEPQASGSNWRYRLYGEKWSIESSPTAQLFAAWSSNH